MTTHNKQPVTSEGIDRLLQLGDQFLEDWSETALDEDYSKADYEDRKSGWETIRPLLVAAPKLLEALESATNTLVKEYGSEAGGSEYISTLRAKITAAKGECTWR